MSLLLPITPGPISGPIPLSMPDLSATFPAYLAARARTVTLAGDIPALLAHPDWSTPAPVMIWLHGRTAQKETDPGRYLRWIRAGVAACALDLPGHGERFEEEFSTPARTLDLIEQAAAEIDRTYEELADPRWGGVFDLDRAGVGGMSAGGMAALRRLCDDHPFRAAAVEGAAGSLRRLYQDRPGRPWPVRHDADRVRRLDPIEHIGTWRPIPLLALHSEADELVPLAAIGEFISALRSRYESVGADPSLVRLHTWPATGAPQEHLGFGRHASDAKTIQTEFLSRALSAREPEAPAAP